MAARIREGPAEGPKGILPESMTTQVEDHSIKIWPKLSMVQSSLPYCCEAQGVGGACCEAQACAASEEEEPCLDSLVSSQNSPGWAFMLLHLCFYPHPSLSWSGYF